MFSGNISITLLHDWIQTILPDIPPRISDDTTHCCYTYKNIFTDATTICQFSRNELSIESESASTIAIFKENITRIANFRRVQLEETISPFPPSVASFLSLVRPKLDYQISLARKMEIVDSIQEITMQESDTSWLPSEYKDILVNQELIRKEFKLRLKSLEYLSGIITDLYVDWNRLNGKDAKKNLPHVQELILSGDFNALVQAFIPSSTKSNKNL